MSFIIDSVFASFDNSVLSLMWFLLCWWFMIGNTIWYSKYNEYYAQHSRMTSVYDLYTVVSQKISWTKIKKDRKHYTYSGGILPIIMMFLVVALFAAMFSNYHESTTINPLMLALYYGVMFVIEMRRGFGLVQSKQTLLITFKKTGVEFWFMVLSYTLFTVIATLPL